MVAKRWRVAMLRLGFVVLTGGLLLSGTANVVKAGLDEYVKKPDPAFAWSLTGTSTTPAGTITEHQAHVAGLAGNHLEPRPPGLRAARDRLSRRDAPVHHRGRHRPARPSDDDHKQAFGLAQLCGARVAVLPQVPNQPLLDGKTEDELIAETFVRYLADQGRELAAALPDGQERRPGHGCRSGVGQGKRQAAVTRFVVTGGSKRGWTTWLTGAVDDRVIAIAPMVIVMLNLGPQGPNQLKVWGQYSEQIHDYVERGLMETVATPAGTNLWKMVDPFTYRDRLSKPKLLINGTNDRYWTLDALDLYWNELKGPKYLIELPNAGHDLKANRDWAIGGLGAFFHHVVTGSPDARSSPGTLPRARAASPR